MPISRCFVIIPKWTGGRNLTESESVFYTLDTNLLMPSELARGPWDSGYAHGGAPAGLAVALVERELKADLWITCRLSLDFYRPVRLRPLSYSIERRQGSPIAHHWITLREGNQGILTAHIVSMRREPIELPEARPDTPVVEDPEVLPDLRVEDMPSVQKSFYYTAMEAKSVPSDHLDGDRRGWFRLLYPMLDSDVLSPTVRAAATADFGSGFSFPLSFRQYLFPNIDMTMSLHREPAGEWIGMSSRTLLGPDGAGVTHSTLLDLQGAFGIAVQTLRVRIRSS